MSFAEAPAETEAQQILAKLDAQNELLRNLTAAVNSLGGQVQWIMDRAEGIFKMFSSPQFMNQMLSGGILNAGNNAAGPFGTESEPGA